MTFVPAGKISDFPPGAMQARQIGGKDIAILRWEGSFYAFSNFCTHEAVTLTSGYGAVRDGCVICMMHGSVFDVATGEALAGPAAEDLTTYAVHIEGDDVLVSVD